MMKLIIFVYTMIMSVYTVAFDTRQYVEVSLEGLLEKSAQALVTNDYENNILYIPKPNKYSVRARVHKMPYACKTKNLFTALKALKYIPEDAGKDAIPPITHCIDLITSSDQVVTSYLQDEVKKYVFNEVTVGDKITLFAIWLYVREENQLPQIITLDFKK